MASSTAAEQQDLKTGWVYKKEPAKKGETFPVRSPLVGDGPLLETVDPSIETVFDMFLYGAKRARMLPIGD